MKLPTFLVCLLLVQPRPSVLQENHTEFDYCSINCDGHKHTMCEYPEGGQPACANFTRKLNPGMIAVLLEVHNELRQQVAMGKSENRQPQAANMLLMSWSEEAARIAQRWVDQCTEGTRQDVCRNLKSGERGAQNFMVTSEQKEFDLYHFQKEAVLRWFKTGKYLDQKNLHSYKSDPKSDHYARIVWALSDKIGCGFSKGVLNGSEVYRLACNYYPAPVEGDPVYLVGRPCSKCPYARCSEYMPALCAPKIDSVHNRGNSGAESVKGGLWTVWIFGVLVLIKIIRVNA
ncbi:venom allergen 5-like [Macrosteles quadrilineatus]|uniref:venom allergen 5-like n=1 Tax=Macrosteles quadrilineatus TaxID=74068 RepID=UPI0023E2DB8E|nr:venom allergen 5-like [Macrosteles quadrilineatus]